MVLVNQIQGTNKALRLDSADWYIHRYTVQCVGILEPPGEQGEVDTILADRQKL